MKSHLQYIHVYYNIHSNIYVCSEDSSSCVATTDVTQQNIITIEEAWPGRLCYCNLCKICKGYVKYSIEII